MNLMAHAELVARVKAYRSRVTRSVVRAVQRRPDNIPESFDKLFREDEFVRIVGAVCRLVDIATNKVKKWKVEVIDDLFTLRVYERRKHVHKPGGRIWRWRPCSVHRSRSHYGDDMWLVGDVGVFVDGKLDEGPRFEMEMLLGIYLGEDVLKYMATHQVNLQFLWRLSEMAVTGRV